MNTDKIYAESMASEYTVKDSSNVTKLHKLDNKAKLRARVVSYCVGIVSLALIVLGNLMSLYVITPKNTFFLVLGIILTVIGIIGMSFNANIYKYIEKKDKSKYASDIIRLANAISEESTEE